MLIKRVLLAAVLFYLVFNRATYKLVDSLLGRFFRIARNGSPTPIGMLVHTLVFLLLFWYLSPMISGMTAKDWSESRKKLMNERKELMNEFRKAATKNDKDAARKKLSDNMKKIRDLGPYPRPKSSQPVNSDNCMKQYKECRKSSKIKTSPVPSPVANSSNRIASRWNERRRMQVSRNK